MDWLTAPSKGVGGSPQLPGDKSISHRALMFNALGKGKAVVKGLLDGEDCRATANALRAMGVTVEESAGEHCIYGVGLHGLRKPDAALDFGNSGTAMRLMAGVLAAQSFASELRGDSSLSRRPMARIIRPLTAMGAQFKAKGNRPPLKITPVEKLFAVRYGMPVASAQVKSAILLAALYTEGLTEISQPAVTRDHSERLLSAMGADLETEDLLVRLRPGQSLQAVDIDVPADLSSAAFLIVAACLMASEPCVFEGVGVNPTRCGVLTILESMGANIRLENQRQIGGEPVADIHVSRSALKAIEVPQSAVPLAIDEFPVLFVAAAAAAGTTVFTGIEELRHKESDRITTMINGLREMGVRCEESEDSASITGGGMGAATVESCEDHRISMAFAVAGLIADGPLRIRGVDNVATSFPGFSSLATSFGFELEEVSD
ncbi:MAG: 3-phosphoshikimate 1-carboxyvinyltransferase [Pseudomonadota bacterium]